MNLTILTIIGSCTGLVAATLLYVKTRKRFVNGRMPIDIDFDHAKRMENKSR